MRQSVDSDPNHNHNHENSKVKEESPRVFGISTSHLTASMTMNDVTNHNSIAINLDPSRISSSSIIDDSTISANLLARNTMVITDLKPQRKPAARNSEVGNGPVHYQGTTLNMAAGQGNLPLFVMLWGMSKAKKVNLLASDVEGNNPLHHAARAETTEVITFMFGQTKGFYTPEVRLVDTRNNLGETPLLKAATIGKISVVKAFLEEGSDPFVANDTGDTVFITLAKFGHLWAFHYLFIHIRDKYNEHTVLDHLHACDSDGHNCLDWAADSGTVNLIEYLIRRGMNPQRLDSCGRGPLFWAVKSHRTDAVRFLLRCGCDPHATDSSGISPYSTAKERRDSDLLYLIAKESKKNRLKQQQQQQTSAFKSSNYEAPPTTTEEANSADLATSDIEQPNMTSETNFTSKDLQMVQMNQIAGHTGQFLHSTSSHYLRQSQSSNGHLRQSQSSQGDIDLVATSLLPPSPPSAPTGNTPPQGRGKHHTPRGSFSTMSSTGVSPARLTFQLLKFTQSATMSFHNDPLASDPDGLELVSYAAPRSYLNFLCSSSVESKDKSGEIRHSHAIQQADSTRFLPCLYYLALYSGFWVLTMCIPFYFWLALLGITVALYRHWSEAVSIAVGKSDAQQQSSSKDSQVASSSNSGWRELSDWFLRAMWSFYQAPEKYVAAHMSLFIVYAFFWASCLCYRLNQASINNGSLSSYFLYSGFDTAEVDTKDSLNAYRTPFQLGGLSGGQFDVELLWAILAMLVVTFVLWFSLAMSRCDPGSIDSRVRDFDTIMDRSIASRGSPSSRYCCRTTLCIKPMRSKYDRATELLVARMDHYCIWLNHTVGFKNHRLFLSFLFSQFALSFLVATFIIRTLARELNQVCGITEALVGPHYFFVTTLLACTLVLEIGLLALLFDQVTNIVMNRTVNEKLNYARYPYMIDEAGNYCNKFDKGWFSNIMEFLHVPGYFIDYTSLFDTPTSNVEVVEGNLRSSTASSPHREKPETPRSVHSVDSETLSVRSQPLFPASFSASASQKSELEFFGFMSTAAGSMSRSATPLSQPDHSLLQSGPTSAAPAMSSLLPMFPSSLIEPPKRVVSVKRIQQSIAPLRASNNVNYDQIYSIENKDKVQNSVNEEV